MLEIILFIASSIKSTQKSIDATPLQLGLGEFKSDRNTENNTFSSRVFYPLSTLSGGLY